jgi:DNA polymerase-1
MREKGRREKGSEMSEQKIYIIDTMSQVYRAFHAIRGLSTAENFPTNALFGFVSMLQKILKTYRPEFLVAATDTAAPTHRHEAYAEYKATRKPMPDELSRQIPFIYDLLAAHGVPLLAQPGYEADDIIAALAVRGRAEGFTVYILSSDKDLYQLVGDGVFVLDTKSDVVYDPGQVGAKLGVRPDQVVDFLALTGDTSDNIPGAPGIGPKTAQTLLSKFGTLDECLERLEEVEPPRIQEILRQHRQQVLDSRELARLRSDVPLQWTWEELRRTPPDSERLRDLYTRFEFKRLLQELEPAPAAPAPRSWECRPGGGPLAEWRDRQPAQPLAGLFQPPDRLYLAPVEEAVMCRLHPRRDAEALAGWWRSDAPKRFHYLKPLLLETDPGPAGGPVEDLELMHYLAYPHVEDHSLERIALDVTGQALPPLPSGKGRAEPLLETPADEAAQWGPRLAVVHAAAGPLRERLDQLGLNGLYRDLELPLVPILAAMERTGILLDIEFLEHLSGEMGERIATLEEEIYRLAGEPFNINSPKQLGEILFEKLQLPVLKKTKKTKSYSTGVEVLEQLAMEFALPAWILDYRQLAKLKSTYVDALPRLANPATGRVHTTFHQTVAATGRLSSANPNLQNIPIRTEEGQKIRRAFIAPPGWRLVAADYSQIELRLMAHLSGDPKLIAAFQSGMDIHMKTAQDVFGAAADANPSEFRRRAKVVNFSIIYGTSDFGLAQNLKIPQREAREIIESYFATYPGVRRWIDENLDQARQEGVVRTLWGRIRPMPELVNSDRNIQKMGERIATNAPVQGTAADIIKLAMIRLDESLRAAGSAARLLLQVHDELVLECPEAEVDALKALIRPAMEQVAELAVPLTVDIHDGANWLEAK